MSKKVFLAGALALGFTLGSAAIPAADNEPIRIGAMTSSSGTAPISESIEGLKAYLERVNQAGGVQGRKLQLIWVDDGGDAPRARELAHKLVETDKVVAMVGGASTVECAANAAYYQQQGIISLPGTGVEEACFTSPAIAPLNAGPYVGLGSGLRFASEVLGHQKVCAVLLAIPGMENGFRDRIAQWSRANGRKLAGAPIPYNPAEPVSAVLGEIEARACTGVVFVGLEKATLELLGSPPGPTLKNLDWIFMTPAYTSPVAKLDAKGWKGIYTMSEFAPWSSADLPVRDWKEQLNLKKVPLSSLSQGGYVAGQVFVEALQRIKGKITRESVLKQLLFDEPIANPMLPAPFVFGPEKRHNPNNQTLPMRLTDKSWRVAHILWVKPD